MQRATLPSGPASGQTLVPNRDLETLTDELDRLLGRGFHTRYAAGFFLVPYLAHLGFLSCAQVLPDRGQGIPAERLSLALIFAALFQKKRFYRAELDKQSDPGLAVLCGLPRFPTDSTLHSYLDTTPTQTWQAFWQRLSEGFSRIGLHTGRAMSLDGKHFPYRGRKKLPKGKHGTRKLALPGLNLLACVDQDVRSVINFACAYPGLGPVPSAQLVLPGAVASATVDKPCAVFDRWFSVGELLDWLDKELGIHFVTLLRRHQNRIEEMQAIPYAAFRRSLTGQPITSLHTQLRNFEGPVRLVVVIDEEDGQEVRYGYLTNEADLLEDVVAARYRARWGIEQFFTEAPSLGADQLPGWGLHQATGHFAHKFLAYNLVRAFLQDVGQAYDRMQFDTAVDTLFQQEALVESTARKLTITFFRTRRQEELAPLFEGLEEDLLRNDVDPYIPWLGGRRLAFRFR